MKPRLSKSRFVSGRQCLLRLWNECYARDRATPVDEVRQAIFDTGHEVGALARDRFPGGRLVAFGHRQRRQALDETARLVTREEVPALYEPAFEHAHMLVRVDVLARRPDGGWHLVEVKSSTGLKDVHVLDVAAQLWVLRGAGVDVRDASVLTLNRDYVYDGRTLDLEHLFALHPAWEPAGVLLDEVGASVDALHEMLAGPLAPDIEPGAHCFAPYECSYHAHCTRDAVWPEHGLEELPRLAAGRRADLEAHGCHEIREVPEAFPLTELQRIVRGAVREDRACVHGDLGAALKPLRAPVRYLDFETFAPAIPQFAGTRPYDAIPFLFSLHTSGETEAPDHDEYLHERAGDPRPALADALISACGDSGSVCTYSSFERRVIRSLAEALPGRADALLALEERLFDLLPVVRNGYYHPGFRGSFSIKQVLPVLVPGMGYDGLAIADGLAASAAYERALRCNDLFERQQIFDDLRRYCAHDTAAMVHLHAALQSLA